MNFTPNKTENVETTARGNTQVETFRNGVGLAGKKEAARREPSVDPTTAAVCDPGPGRFFIAKGQLGPSGSSNGEHGLSPYLRTASDTSICTWGQNSPLFRKGKAQRGTIP